MKKQAKEKQKRKKRPVPVIEALEPRLLFSADPLSSVVDTVGGDSLESLLDDATLPESHPDDSASQSWDAQDDQTPTDTPTEAGALEVDLPLSKELVIIDPATPDYYQLLDELVSQSSNTRQIDVVILDANREGVSQISDILTGYSGLDAIHLISHATDGAISLGSSTLDATTLQSNTGEISGWGDAFSENGDFLIYGCNLAASEQGEAFIGALAQLTGADVAGSDDVTGSAELGGDWDLEYQTGDIETEVPFELPAFAQWQGTLDITSNLVAHYTFDEGSGTTAGDSSATNNDGTLLDSPVWASGKIGSGALDFSGDFDRVEAADNVALDYSGDFSVSFWFNSTQTPGGSARLVGQSAGSDGFVIYTDSSGDINWMVAGGGGSTTLGAAAPLDGNWHLVTAVRSGDNFELFIDGTSTATSTAVVGDASSSETLRIGSSSASSSEYDGLLDDVRIYDRALSVSDVTELYSYTGASSPTDLDTVATTDGGLSINTDGGNDVYLVADDGGAIFGGRTNLTIETQFSITTQSADETTLLSYASAVSENEVKLVIESDGRLSFAIGNIEQLTSATYLSLLDGETHHVAVSWSSVNGALSLYVDGNLEESFSGFRTGYTITGGGTLLFGQEQDSLGGGFQTVDQFQGTLYDVRIFDDVRSAAEVSANYRSTVPYDESGLVANWRFNDFSDDGVVSEAVSGNNLTLQHVSGFTASTPSLTLSVNENAFDGTVVGTVSGIDTEREALIASLLAADPDLRYSAETGKFYKVVSASDDWTVAKTNAESTSLNGINGQLAVVRSAAENEVLQELASATSGGSIWLGGSDTAVEGEWRWIESGSDADRFWDGDVDGYQPSGAYTNWFSSTQPNDLGGAEDAIRLDSTNGKWYDAPTTGVGNNYAVEWDADAVLDATQALTYSIQSQTVAGAFAIDADSGQITVADGSLLDYETNATHSLTVRVTNGEGNTYDEAFTIALNNLTEANNAPTDLSSGIELNTDGGNDAYLIAGDGGAVLGGLTSVSLEIQFATDDTVSFTPLFSYASPSNDNEFALVFAGTDAYLYIADNDILLTGIDYTTLRDGTLQHLAVTWDSTNGDWALYSNGELIEHGTGHEVGNALEAGGELVFGNEQDTLGGTFQSDQSFQGTLYDIRIWNEVRSEAEIALNYQTKIDSNDIPTGLVANWQMDGFDGSNEVVDVVSGNNLSIGHAAGSTTNISNWSNQTGSINASGSTVTFTGSSTNNWDTQVNSNTFSSLGYTDNYSVSFTVDNLPTEYAFVIGLGTSDSGPGGDDIDQGIYFVNIFSDPYVMQNGSLVTNSGMTVNPGDVFTFVVDGTSLHYQQNGTTFYTATISQGTDWYLDTGFLGTPDSYSISDIKVFDASGGGFTTSTPVEDLHVIENATNGTSVGYVVPTDPDIHNDIVSDGQFLEATPATTQYGVTGTFGDWTVTQNDIDLFATTDWESPLGGRVINLDGSAPGAIEQTLTTVAGIQYQVVFALTGDFGGGEAVKDLRVSAAGQSEDFAVTQSDNWAWGETNAFETRSFTFTAEDSSTALSFTSLEGPTSQYGPYIADIQVIELPAAVTTILNNDSTLSYDAATGKFYRYVQSWETFADAKDGATSATLNGVAGDLVAISSAYENDLIQSLVGTDYHSWLSGSDQAVEGTWRWYDGDTAGDVFWSGDSAGSAQNGFFTNFVPGEPNASVSTADGLVIRGETGLWDDLDTTAVATYTIQWDASEVLSSFAFALTDDAGGRFAIDSSTGEITVADGSQIDYETATSHSVTVEVTDAAGNTYSEAMTITVDDGLDPLIASDDSVSTDKDTPLVISPLANDSGSGKIIEFTQPANGSVVDNGDGTLTYTPDGGYTGADSFDYVIGDADTNATLTNSWGLDGNVGDSVGSMDGTLNGTTTVAGTIGNGLAFNESSDYALIPDVAYGAEFTISFDFKLDDNSGSLFQYLYSHGDINAANSVNIFVNEASHGTDPNVMRTVIRDSDDTVDNFALQFNISGIVGDGQWHTYTATVSAGGIEVFLDGVSQATDATRGTGGVNPAGSLYLGARQDLAADRYFGGSLDSLRIYDSALTTSQVTALSDSSTGTVNITVNVVNDAPIISNLDSDILNYSEGNGAVPIDLGGDALVTDSDSANFDGGTLNVELDFGGVAAEDVLSIRNQGTDPGQISISGNNVVYGGTVIGIYTGGTGLDPLNITFNSNATSAAVTALLQNITYQNIDSENPTAGSRSIAIDITDGDGGSSLTQNVTVNVADVNDAPTFSIGDGVVLPDIVALSDGGVDVVVQDDGKILVLSSANRADSGQDLDFVLTRYNADGTLDTGFGTDGIVITAVNTNNEAPNSIALQADGKILVAGGYVPEGSGTVDSIVMRYNSDGTLDTGFSTDGMTEIDFSTTSTDMIKDMVVQPDGKIVVVGYGSFSGINQLTVARLNSDGSLDTSFDGDGITLYPINGSGAYGNEVELLSDGRIIISGYAHNGTDNDVVIISLNPDGSLDTSFDTDGIRLVDIGASESGTALVVDGSDNIYVAGTTTVSGSGDTFVIKLDDTGSLVTGFGTNGVAVHAIGSPYEAVNDMVLQEDGKIIIVGDAYNGSNTDVSVIRLNSDGSLDTSFDSDGKIRDNMNGATDAAKAVALDSNGNILIVGNTSIDGAGESFVARYTSEGQYDQRFDLVTTLDGNPTFTEGGAAVVLDADVSISDPELDAANGGLGNYDGASLTIARNGGTDAEDLFSFNAGNGISKVSGNLVKNGEIIASFDTATSGQLVITFTDANGEIPTSADADNILRQIVYANSSDSPPASVQLDWTFDDGNSGDQGSGGSLTVTGSTTVNITAVNDAPVLDLDGDDSSGGATGNHIASFTEGDAPVAVIDSDVSIVDTDSPTMSGIGMIGEFTGSVDVGQEVYTLGGESLVIGTARIAYVTQGTTTFEIDFSDGVSLNIGVSSGSGSISDFEALLATMTYQHTGDNPTAGARSFSLMVSDPDGGHSNTVVSIVNVSAVNDDPVNSGSLPGDVLVQQDSASAIDLSAINVGDVDAAGADVSVKLVTSSGGNITAAAGSGITVTGNGTSDVTLRGTVTDLNAYLDNATNIQYLHGTPGTWGNDADTIQVSLNDLGNTGSGGGGDVEIGTINIDINATPLAAGDSYNAFEGAPYTAALTVDDLLLNDSDPDGGLLTVNTTPISGPSNGQLLLNADGTFVYTPDAGFNGIDSFVYEVDDGNGGTAQATATITVYPRDIRILFSTNSDIANSKVPGLDSWESGEVLAIADPNLMFEPAGSDGSILGFMDLESFAADSEMVINGLHFVSNPVTVGSANAVVLQHGDVLFTAQDNEVMTSTNSLAVDAGDVIIFRPDTAGDYSAGTFIHLLEQPGAALTTGITLIENDITIGDVTLDAGSFLFTQDDGGSNIYHFSADDAGVGTTGTVSVLVDGSELGLGGESFAGLMIVTDDLNLPGAVVPAGSLITTLTGKVNGLGSNSLALNGDEMFYLTVNTTTMGSGTTDASATLLFDAGDIGLNNENKDVRAFTLIENILPPNQDPVVSLSITSLNYTEGDPATIIDAAAILTDADSINFNEGLLRVDLAATGTADDRLAINDEGTGAGQIGISGTDVTYGGIVIGTWSGGVDGFTPLTVQLNSNSDEASVQALMRNITYENVSSDPSETQRQVRFSVTDGDGGSSDLMQAAIVVNGANAAPVLTGANDLDSINEDFVSNPGTLVADLVSGWVTDVDPESITGIAVVGVDNTNGTWEFSTDGGANWVSLGSPSSTNMRLLAGDADTYVRFVPNANWNGTVANGITFHAWDQTSGANGDVIDVTAAATIRDEFNIASYSANDGTDVWTSAWTEVNDDGSASTGNIRIENNKLHIDNQDGGSAEYVYRSADLSDAISATLTLDFDAYGGGTVDTVTTGVSLDGGITWTTLRQGSIMGNSSGTRSMVIEDFVPLTNNMLFRFGIVAGMDAPGEYINFDNIDITWTGGGSGGSSSISVATASSGITVNPVEDEAVITGDISGSGNEGTVISGDLNATDVDGLTDTTYFTVSAQGSNGTASIDAETGAWSYTPTDPNWFGSDQFTVTVTDDQGGTTEQLVSVTLTNVEDEAVITGDISGSGNEGTVISGDLNATDVDGLTDTTYFTVSAQGSNGTASIDAETGAWSYTPTDPNWFGSDQFTVTVTDDQGGTTEQIISVTLTNVEDEAVITGDISGSGNEGTVISGDLNATDVDGLTDTTYFTVSAQGSNGTASIDAETGAWSYTPTDPNWFGSDQFTVTVTDDQGGTTEQIISVTLTNVEDEAVITGDISGSGNEGTVISGDLNATDVDGLTDTTYFTVSAQGSNGTASIDAETGAWSYTPTDPNWFGSDQFTVTVTDDQGGTTEQLVSVTLTNVEDEAVITGDISGSGNEGTVISGDLNATDVDGLTDTTYFTVSAQGSNGTASIDAETGAWSYTPTDPNWFGSDQFTVTVTDDQGGTTEQIISVTLTNVEDEAVITGDISGSGNEGTVISGDLNATDVDGLTDTTYFTVSAQGSNGTASIDAETGAWSYTPTDPNWFGSDQFTVTVTDDQGGTTEQIISVTLTNVEDEAVITGDISGSANEGNVVSGDLNATDVDGLTDTTYFTVSAQGANGTAVIDAETGAWSYTPTDPNWFGSDQFTVTVTDDQGGTTEQIINITLTNVEDEAVITGDISGSGNEGTVISGDLNATDVDGLTDTTYFTVSAQGSNGTASIDAETGAWSYTPTDPNWFGSDQFTVTVTDDQGGTTEQLVSVTLTNVEDEAVISGDISGSANEGNVVSGDLNATDVDGLTDTTYFTVSAQGSNGTASIDAETGAWSYTPTDPNWFGSDQFTVTVTDDQGGTTEQIISVTLTNVEDEAVITGDTSGSANEGNVVSGDLNATDVDGLTDTTYFTVSAQGSNGTASIDAETGAWSYTPTDPNWFGSDQFTVTVTDDQGGTTEQIISVTLTNVEDEAVITGDISGSANEGNVVSGDLNATDVDGLTDTTYFTVSAQGSNGTASIDAETGAWSYTPTDPNWFGSDQFTVTVTDDQGGTTEQIISVTLTNVEDEAVITGDISGSANEGNVVSGDLNATDVDGLTDTTYFTVSAQGSNGTASIDAETGAWSYTPTDPNWFGSDQFTVTVTDDQGGTTEQLINITLTNVEDEAVITGDISGSANEGNVVSGDLNATDVDGLTDTTYFTVSAQGSNGTASIDAETGAWSYTPTDPNWFGSDQFTVTVTDDQGGTTEQIISVTLTNVEDEAVITGDISGSGNEGTVISGDLNATDVDGLTDTTYFTVSAQGANGTAVIDAETGAWSYTPTDPNWFGSDQFTVTVTDDQGGTTEQLISITLTNVEDEAVITGDISGSGNEGTVISGDLNATDVDGLTDTTYFTVSAQGSNGTASIDAETGAWSYTPTDPNWFGSDQFTVTVTDDQGGTTEQIISVTLTNVEDEAVITGDISGSANEGNVVSGDLNATDVDGLTDTTYFTVSAQGSNGTASIDAETGAWSYTPTDPNWFGSDQFTVTVTDDQGGTTEQLVSVTLTNVEDEAVITGDISGSGNEGTVISGDLNATDVDGLTDTTYFTVSAQGSNGTASIDAETGAWSYTPTDPNWFGSDQFTVTVTDDQGGTTEQIINITLTNVEDEAVITGDISGSGNEGTVISGDLNATDVDGLTDTTYFTVSAQGSNGTASIDAETGAWSYTPTDPNWFGSDQFTVTVTDDQGGTTEQIISVTLTNVEDEAVITGDISGSGNEGTVISGDLNATDVDGLTDTTYFTVSAQGSNGTASIDAETGAWSYTPTDPNWFGSDQFTVTVTDDQGGTTEQLVSVTLTNVEDEAVITGDISGSGNEGTVISGDLNATDVDGLTDTTYFTVSAQGSNGTASIDAETGAWSYTPTDPNWFGSDQFTVTVTDDQGGTTEQIINITLTNVEDEAVITGDISGSGNEGTVISGDLNATDVDGLTDTTYFTVSAQGSNGTASIDAETGAWSYTPTDPNWFGSDQFTVTVTDDQGGTTEQIISVTLTNVEDEAVITGDISGSGNEGTVISGDLNATDVDGLTDTTYFTVSAQGSNGTASIDAETGAWSYTPTDPNWFGSDQFTVTVTDDQGGTTEQIISVTLTNVEDEAVITGDISGSANEGNVVSGDLNATDVDGLTDTTYFTVSAQGANGTASIDAETGAWSYTPTDPNWFGSDQFTVTVTDDQGGTTEQIISVTLTNVEDEAVITGDISGSGNEGTVISGDLNATDVDGLTDTTYFTVSAQGANGTAVIDAETGAWSYTPTDPNWFGSDQFTVTVTDDQGGTTEQIISVTLTNVEDEAVITGDISGSGNEGTVISGDLNATDVDGLTDTTYFTVSAQGSNGTASIDAETGAWSYTPTDPNWFGSDQFTVTVTDDQGGTTEQLVSVTLTNVEDEAVITGDISGSGNEGTVISGDLNATDVDGLTDTTYFTVSAQGSNGTASIDAETGAWSYTPTDPNWFGSDQFTVTVTDDQGGTTEQIISVTLTNVEDEAVITGDISGSGNEGTVISGDLNATDVDGLTDTTYFTVSAQGANGTASIDAETGAWSYTPTDPNWFGSDQFTVTVTDDQGGTTEQLVSVTLTNVEDEAVITGDISGSANEGNVVSGDLNATDVDGLTDTTYFTVSAQGANGTASIDAETGAWSYTPTDPNWFGSDQFTVTVTDDQGGTTEQIISVTLTNVEDEAVITGDISGSGNEGTVISGDLNATDVDGLTDTTYFTVSAQGSNGTASIDAETGAWSYTPTDPNWFGSDQFTVTVTDDQGGTTEQIISVTLTNVEDEAVITGDISGSGNEGTVISGDLNATDVDGLTDTTYFTVSAQGANGTAVIDAETGAWSYTPTDPNWFGSDQFTVTVTDDQGGTTEQIISVTLTNVEDEAVITGDISGSGNEGTVISGDLNATDVDGLTDTTYFTVSAQGSNGTASIDAETGAWSYTPTDPNWFGSDQFTVTVTDDQGGTTEQIISVTLTNVEDEAVITGDISGSANEGNVVSGDLNATDVDGLTDTTYFTVSAQGSNGTASIDAETGAWSYTPTDPNWFGSDQFTVTVTDDQGGTTEQIISVTLTNVEDEAVITGDISGSANEGNVVSGDLNATDVDGLTDTTYFTVSAQGSNGTASIDAETGAWSYTPTDPNWFGSDQFTVTVTDDQGGTTEQIISVTLTNVEDEAVITGDTSSSGNEGNAVIGGLNSLPGNGDQENNQAQDESDEIDDENEDEALLTDEDGSDDTSSEVDSKSALAAMVAEEPTLQPIDGALIANVVSDLSGRDGGNDYQRVVFRPIPPKSIDLNHLNITPFETTENMPLQITSLMENDAFVRGLEEMNRDLDRELEEDQKGSRLASEAMVGVTMSLSAGFVNWVLRAGSLMAGFMSMAPLWKQLDPLPILGASVIHRSKKSKKRDDESEDTHEVEEIFEQEEVD